MGRGIWPARCERCRHAKRAAERTYWTVDHFRRGSFRVEDQRRRPRNRARGDGQRLALVSDLPFSEQPKEADAFHHFAVRQGRGRARLVGRSSNEMLAPPFKKQKSPSWPGR